MSLDRISTCRTCLNSTSQNEFVNISPVDDNNSSILEMLSFTIPELNMFLVTDPVICKNCVNLLKICFNFKTDCLKNEEHLLKHLQNNNNTKIDIRDVPLPRFRNRRINNSYVEINNECSTIQKAPPRNKSRQIGNPLLNCDQCNGCKFKLSNPSIHSKVFIPPITCYKCHKETDNIQEMRKHMLGHFRQRKCKICHKYFRDLYQLKTHLRVHTQMNPYKCNLCEKSFRQKHSLTQHLHQHTGSESVSCKYCHKPFSTKYNAKVHMRTTHKILQKCDLCGETFKTKSELVKHLETSTETCRGGEVKTEVKEEVEDIQVDENLSFIKTETVVMQSMANTEGIAESMFSSEAKKEL